MNMKPRSSRSAKAIERNELQRQARLKAVQDALPPEQRLNARTDWDDPVFKPYALPPKHARAAMRQEMAEQAADNQDRQKATVNANVNKAGANDTGALRKGVCQCCTLINPGEHNKASRDDIPILTKQDFLNDKTDATWEKFKRDTYMAAKKEPNSEGIDKNDAAKDGNHDVATTALTKKRKRSSGVSEPRSVIKKVSSLPAANLVAKDQENE